MAFIPPALDPKTRTARVRFELANSTEQVLRPEMYANVSIFAQDETAGVAVPREALIYEGSAVRVWVAHEDKTIELRQLKTGLTKGRMVQALDGIAAGERVVTKGSLFIDRAATGS